MANNIAFARTTVNTGRPPFLVDEDAVVLDTGRQVAWEYLDARYEVGAVAVQLNGVAAAAAVSITVDPLLSAVQKGTTIRFDAGEFAYVTADAAAGATTLAVEALPAALEDNDIGYVDTNASLLGRQLPPGTIMAELTDGRMVPRAVRPGAETAKYLLATYANEDSATDAASGYGIIKSAAVYENLLPESTGTPKVANSTYKTELLAQGGYWMFEQYADNT